MKILVACEESQAVTIELRRLGHEAYSCDIIECSGGHHEWHIRWDALALINGNCSFLTCDGELHSIEGKWDMLIAHPPCTHLAVSGARWFKEGKKPLWLQDEAAEFFMMFVNADCERIAIENPVCIMSTRYRKPDQIINPWQFGHPEQKKTCLWLKGLPLLRETENVYDYMMTLPVKQRTRIWQLGSNHAKERSKTFPGIAKAMAEQWGGDMREVNRMRYRLICYWNSDQNSYWSDDYSWILERSIRFHKLGYDVEIWEYNDQGSHLLERSLYNEL